MSDIKILLVHGSCHGAWCWDLLIPELIARDVTARALDLPGHGQDRTPPGEVTLDLYAEAVVSTMRDMGGKVVLLGHSAGGYAISAAATRAPQMVEKLIFLCAYLPKSGMSLSDMRKVWPQQPLMPHLIRAADGQSFTFDVAEVPNLFYHDCPPQAVDRARRQLCPQPMLPQTTALTLSRYFQDAEKHYIICAEDRAIPPDYQRVMAQGLPASAVSELPASHSPFLSMPDRLANRILDIVRA